MRWLALILLPYPAVGQQVENPRSYGWWLGDERVQLIHVPGEIDTSTLPRARSVDYWLDLREVTQKTVRGGTELTLR